MRFAFKITEQVIEMASQLTNTDSPTILPEDMYLLITMVGPVEFNAKLVSADEVFEEFKKDATLQVL